jgi:CDP-glucose 4,6-dehydratase
MPKADLWSGRRVLLTGHTGFKGAWTAALLAELGAEVTAVALPPDGEPNLWKSFDGRVRITETICDIRDASRLAELCRAARPEIVLHMAAQAQVRRGYLDPATTYSSNVMGTLNLLEATRLLQSLQAMLIVTSDKVYSNRSDSRMFVETDPLGGSDPYSASKAAVELLVRSHVESYFAPRRIPVATARAGNVLGGGDFSSDRLVPDIFRSARTKQPLVLRYPDAQRSWFHVLDCITGYLKYIEFLSGNDVADPPALNLGPLETSDISVADVANIVGTRLGITAPWKQGDAGGLSEKTTLKLDCGLARGLLGWSPSLDVMETMAWTADWYAAFADGADAFELVSSQIKRYLRATS